MSEPTLIEIIILIGVFVITLVTLWKLGVDSALKIWGGMGALTGVAFGAITSYYFTAESKQTEIVKLQTQIEKKMLYLTPQLQKQIA